MTEELKKECSGDCKEHDCRKDKGSAVETEQEVMTKVGFLDVLISKLTSRKLAVFIICTVFLSLGKITSSDWMLLSSIYVGSEALLDAIIRIKGN